MVDKKHREREIFNMVYEETSFADVVEHERPDFLIRHSSVSHYFGVEVTEFFDSETAARLRRIPDYTGHLLDGKDFKHKDDRKALTVAKVDIINEDGVVTAKDYPAVIMAARSLMECSREVTKRIQSKSDQMQCYPPALMHSNLIVNDNTGLLRVTKQADYYRNYFTPELISVLSATTFREVFLIADVESRKIYFRMKMLLLLAEFFLFKSALLHYLIAQRLPEDTDLVLLFASYFASAVETPVLIHHDKDGVEVIFGDSGIMIDENGSWKLRMHSDRPIHPDAEPAPLHWETLLGTDFHVLIAEYRKSNTFEGEVGFPVKSTA